MNPENNKNLILGFVGQVLLTLCLIFVMGIAVIAYLEPDWLDTPLQQDVLGAASEYTVLKPETEPEIKNKNFNISIEDSKEYTLKDSKNINDYFVINPLLEDEGTQITHEILNNILTVNLKLQEAENRTLTNYLAPTSTLIIGSTEIPMNIGIHAKNDNSIKINLSDNQISHFKGIFENKETDISFSEYSIPKKLTIKAVTGITRIEIPQNTSYTIDYEIDKNAELFLNKEEIKGTGKINNTIND